MAKHIIDFVCGKTFLSTSVHFGKISKETYESELQKSAEGQKWMETLSRIRKLSFSIL